MIGGSRTRMKVQVTVLDGFEKKPEEFYIAAIEPHVVSLLAGEVGCSDAELFARCGAIMLQRADIFWRNLPDTVTGAEAQALLRFYLVDNGVAVGLVDPENDLPF